MNDSPRGQNIVIKQPMSFGDEHLSLVSHHGYADRGLDKEAIPWDALLLA